MEEPTKSVFEPTTLCTCCEWVENIGKNQLEGQISSETKLTKKQRQKRNQKLRQMAQKQAEKQREIQIQEERAREERRQILKSKLGEQRIKRGTKQAKEKILDQTLKSFGIDKEKFKKDLEAVKKQGGMEINLKQD